ncbi:mycothiol transferase [Actinokineospora sp. HUAS TT18]|uniref:mycothiol transferase n=1 Tax=Actinokineospora sp. HUAS TT18 TaxID=3447451 RepID=UPI003F52052A
MTSADLVVDAFGRIAEEVRAAVDGFSVDELAYRVDEDANSIAWLVWHLTRIQDDHIAGVSGLDQVWLADGWARRFDLPFPDADHGYGHTIEQVAAVRVDADLLAGYHAAVHRQSTEWAAGITDADLERIVDRAWDPPVTLGVRVVSVLSDCLQHVGQAAFVRGILLR